MGQGAKRVGDGTPTQQAQAMSSNGPYHTAQNIIVAGAAMRTAGESDTYSLIGHPPPPDDERVVSRNGRRRSMGMGNTVVELFSVAISVSVWR